LSPSHSVSISPSASLSVSPSESPSPSPYWHPIDEVDAATWAKIIAPTGTWNEVAQPTGIWDDIEEIVPVSYTNLDKPEYKNFLLTQEGDFLLNQDGSKINIHGSGYDDIERPPELDY